MKRFPPSKVARNGPPAQHHRHGYGPNSGPLPGVAHSEPIGNRYRLARFEPPTRKHRQCRVPNCRRSPAGLSVKASSPHPSSNPFIS